jgi:hypothetical protein
MTKYRRVGALMGVGTRTVLGSAFTKRLRRFAQPTPVVAPLIASEALKCSRRIGFRLLGVRPDIEWTREDRASFESGDWFDSICAEVIVQERDARIQLPFHWLPLLALKGKADGGYRTTMQRKVVVEVKSTNERAGRGRSACGRGSRRHRRRSGWCRAAWPRVRR